MTVLIWENSGHPFDGHGYGDRIRQRLNSAGFASKTISYLSEDKRHICAEVFDCLAHIWTGGDVAVSDPRMQIWKNLLLKQIEDSKNGGPLVFGICLGSQLMAEAVGGAGIVQEASKGLEIGMCCVESVNDTIYPYTSYNTFNVCQFHYHEINPAFLKLPEVDLLFTNAHSTVQGFRIGKRALGYQFHPDFDLDDCNRVVHCKQELIASMRPEYQYISGKSPSHPISEGDCFQELIIGLLKSNTDISS